MIHTVSKGMKKQTRPSEFKERGPFPLMLQLKEKIEDQVIDTTMPASSVRLPEHAKNALPTLQNAMYPGCPVHSIDFRVLYEGQEFEHGEALAADVHFRLSDLAYNIRRIRDDEKLQPRNFCFYLHDCHVKDLW